MLVITVAVAHSTRRRDLEVRFLTQLESPTETEKYVDREHDEAADRRLGQDPLQ